VGRPDGKRPFGKSRRRLDGNIKMDLQEVDGVAWSDLVYHRIGTGGGRLCIRQ